VLDNNMLPYCMTLEEISKCKPFIRK